MDQPLKANFFLGILEWLAGRLGLMPPGVTDPPTSSRVGMSQRWAATLREAVRETEGRDIDLEQITHTMVPPGLHPDYGLDFQTRRVDANSHIPSAIQPCWQHLSTQEARNTPKAHVLQGRQGPVGPRLGTS